MRLFIHDCHTIHRITRIINKVYTILIRYIKKKFDRLELICINIILLPAAINGLTPKFVQ